MKKIMKLKTIFIIILLMSISLFAGDGMTVESDSFGHKKNIPVDFANTGIDGGQNVSPHIVWDNIPADTKSIAVLMWDKHPIANKWVHWAVINISPGGELVEGASNSDQMPKGSRELKNSWGEKGYGGPQPPSGTGRHKYIITVYALSVKKVNLSGEMTRKKFRRAIKGKVLEKKSYVGYFKD